MVVADRRTTPSALYASRARPNVPGRRRLYHAVVLLLLPLVSFTALSEEHKFESV